MKPKYKLEILRSAKNKEFFWRMIHRNGNDICRSSETYKRLFDCRRAVDRMVEAFNDGEWEVDTDGKSE